MISKPNYDYFLTFRMSNRLFLKVLYFGWLQERHPEERLHKVILGGPRILDLASKVLWFALSEVRVKLT